MKRRAILLTLAAGWLAWGSGAMEARANTLTLQQLLAPGATITIGDLTFSHFSYSNTGTNHLAASDIDVSTVTLNGEMGLYITGAFAAGPAGVTSSSDYDISYKVTATHHAKINDLLLVGDPDVSPSANGTDGAVKITDTYVDPHFHTYKLKVFDNVVGGVETEKLSDGPKFIYPVTCLTTAKDIFVMNGGPNGPGDATVSNIYQLYSLKTVPEPASMALLGIGMTGFLAFRRRFKRTQSA
jgi:hypothetical protein